MEHAKTGYGLPSKRQWGLRRRTADLLLPMAAAAPVAAGLGGFALPLLFSALPLGVYAYRQWAKHNEEPPPFIPPKTGRVVEDAFIDFGRVYSGGRLQIPFDKLTRHVLLLGSTGSGKTTLIRNALYYVMQLGGGATFVDGKSDTTDTYEVFVQLVEECDRGDDFFVLNFLSPLQSNTFNPLLDGDDDFCTELCATFLSSGASSGGGDGDYWQQRGLSLMRGVMAVLVWLRDQENRPFTFWDIRRTYVLKEVVQLAMKVEQGEIPRHDPDTGKPVGERLIAYLDELGPWRDVLNPEADPLSIEQVEKQHGFAMQQWSAALDLLGGTYAPIFNSTRPDVRMTDVIENGRILYVLLPSLGKSEATLRQMGQLILGTTKVAMDKLLGRETIGDAEAIHTAVKARRPALPHLGIFDEYGSYAVKGMSTVLAQARSLGYSVWISAQELGRIMRDQAEGEATIANTNFKIVMKIEDSRTMKEVQERAAKEWVLAPGSIRKEYGVLRTMEYADSWSVQEMERIKFLDLARQKPGEAYLIYEDRLLKFRVPYLRGKKVKRLSILVPKPLPGGDGGKEGLLSFRPSQRDVRRVMGQVLNALTARGRRFPVRLSVDVFRSLYRKLGNYGIEVIFGIRDRDEMSPLWRRKLEDVENRFLSLSRQMGRKHGDRLARPGRMARRLAEDAQKIADHLNGGIDLLGS